MADIDAAAGPVSDAPADFDGGFEAYEADLRSQILEEEPDYSGLLDEGTDGVRGTQPGQPANQPNQTAGGLHEDHYQWGEVLGLSREQVEAMPREQFERMVHSVYQRMTAGSRQPQPAPAPPQHPQPDQAAQAAAQQLAEYIGNFEFKPEDADLVDDVTRGMVEHINKRFAQHESIVARAYQQIQSLAKLNGQLMYQEAQRQRQAYEQQAHQTLDSLDEELFGKGDQANDQQRQNRWRVFQEMLKLDRQAHAAGQQLPAIPQRAAYVYRALFADQIGRRQTARAAQATRDRARRAPARPSNTLPKAPPKGDQAAMRHVANWLRQNPSDEVDSSLLEPAAA